MKRKSTFVHHARILTPEGWIDNGCLRVEDGVITSISDHEADWNWHDQEEHEVVDACGKMLLPGFVDVHVHGGGGFDAMRGDQEHLLGMCHYHASKGTTSLLATTLTASYDELIHALEAITETMKLGREPDGASIVGVHLEGPFLNAARCGAQNPEDICMPSLEQFQDYWSASAGAIKLMTIAPELEGAQAVIADAVAKGVTISLGHTNADYETMKQAVEWGATHVTHLFNGMRPLHHREPGAAGAALMLDPLAVELICDGYHVNPDLIRWVFQVKPEGKVVLVTDCMCAAGCPDGEYALGKLPVLMKNGKVYLKQEDGEEGSLAGSSLNMMDALVNAVSFTGKELAEVVPSLTLYPATQIGLQHKKGSIECGKDADFILVDEQLQVNQTYVLGRLVYDCAKS